MPIFEYQCNNCGNVMEFLEKTQASRNHTCTKCESSDLQKLLSGFAVGRSTPSSHACETCPSGPGPSEGCQMGACPHSM